jgi:hypothetical protein
MRNDATSLRSRSEPHLTKAGSANAMQSENNSQSSHFIARHETSDEFFFRNLEASVSRINVCMLAAGIPEEDVWKAFRDAIFKLSASIEEIDHEAVKQG